MRSQLMKSIFNGKSKICKIEFFLNLNVLMSLFSPKHYNFIGTQLLKPFPTHF